MQIFTINNCISLYPYMASSIRFGAEINSIDVDIYQIILKYVQFVVESSSITSWEAQNSMNKQTLKRRTMFSVEE